MSDSVSIRRMTEADLPLGMRLKAAVNWNQTEADWRRFLKLQPDGCFVATVGAQGAGTAAAFVFGNIGWIAMVLVDSNFRRQGIGTALMEHALSFLEVHGVTTIRLDATALGRPVYEKLGFVGEYELARYEGTLRAGETVTGVTDATGIGSIAEIDASISATPRRQLLELLLCESGAHCRIIPGKAFLMDRPGARATHIGPIMALDESHDLKLLQDAANRLAGQTVFVDIPLDNQPATAWAVASGLTTQRTFLRMRRGPAIPDRPRQIWASSGPEKG